MKQVLPSGSLTHTSKHAHTIKISSQRRNTKFKKQYIRNFRIQSSYHNNKNENMSMKYLIPKTSKPRKHEMKKFDNIKN